MHHAKSGIVTAKMGDSDLFFVVQIVRAVIQIEHGNRASARTVLGVARSIGRDLLVIDRD